MSVSMQHAVAPATDRDLFPGISFEGEANTFESTSPQSPVHKSLKDHLLRHTAKKKNPSSSDRVHKRTSPPNTARSRPSRLNAHVSSPDTETFNRLFQEWRAKRLLCKRAQADTLAKRERALAHLAETVAELRLHPVRRTTTPTASSPMATKLSPNRHQVRLPIVNTTSMSALERSIVKSNTSLVASELALSLKSKKNEEKAAEIRARVAAEMRQECDRIMRRDARGTRPRFGQQVNDIPRQPSVEQMHRLERLLPILSQDIPRLLAPRPITPPPPVSLVSAEQQQDTKRPVPVPQRKSPTATRQIQSVSDCLDLTFTPSVIKLTAHQSSATITISQKSLQASRVHWLPVPIEHEHVLQLTPLGPESTRWCRTLHTGHRMDAKVGLKSPGAVQPGNSGLYVFVEINGVTAQWPVVVDADQCDLHVPSPRAVSVSPGALEHSIKVNNRGKGPGTAIVELEDELGAIVLEPESKSIMLGPGDASQVAFCIDPEHVLKGLDTLTRAQGLLGAMCIKSAASGALVAKVPITVTGFARALEWVQGPAFTFDPCPATCPVQQTFLLRNPNPWPERYSLKLAQADAALDVQLTPHQGSISAHSDIPIRIAVAASKQARVRLADSDGPLDFETVIRCTMQPTGPAATKRLSGLFFHPRLELSQSHVALPFRMLTGDKHATTITVTNPLPVPQLVGMDAHEFVTFSALENADHILLEPNASIAGTLCFSALFAGKVATQVMFRGLVPSGPVTSSALSITGHVHQPIVQLSTRALELGIAAPGSITSSTVELSWCFNEREKAGKEHRTQDMAHFVVGNDPTLCTTPSRVVPPSDAPVATGNAGNPALLSPNTNLRPSSPPASATGARPRLASSARPKSQARSNTNLASTIATDPEAANPMTVRVVRMDGPVAEILAGTHASGNTLIGTDPPPLPTDLTRLLHIQNGQGQLQPYKRPTASVSFLFVPPKPLPKTTPTGNPDGTLDPAAQPGGNAQTTNATAPLPSRGSRVMADGSKSLAPPGEPQPGAPNGGKRAGSASKNRSKTGASSAAPRSGAATANSTAGNGAATPATGPVTSPQPPPEPPAIIPAMVSATITYRVPVMIFLTRRHGATSVRTGLPTKHTARFLSEDTRLDWTLQHIDVTCTLTSPTVSIHMPPTVEFGVVATGCVTTTKLRLLNHHPTQALTPEVVIPMPFRLSKALRPIAPLAYADICLALDAGAWTRPSPAPMEGSQVTRKLQLTSHGTRASVLLSGTVYSPQIAWSVTSAASQGDAVLELTSSSNGSTTTAPLTYEWQLGDVYFGDAPTLTLTVTNGSAFPVPIRKSMCSSSSLVVVWEPADVIAPKSSASVTLTLTLPPPPTTPIPDRPDVGQPHAATARIECQGSVLHVAVTWTPWAYGLNLLGLPLVAPPPLAASTLVEPPPATTYLSSIPVTAPHATQPPPPTAMLPLHIVWTRVATLGRGFARQAVYAVTWPRGLFATHLKPGHMVPVGKGEGGGTAAGKQAGGKGGDKHAPGGVHASLVFGEFHMPGAADDSADVVQAPAPLSRPTSPGSGGDGPKPTTPPVAPPVAAVLGQDHRPHTSPPVPTSVLVRNLFCSVPKASCITVPVGQAVPVTFAMQSTEYVAVLSSPSGDATAPEGLATANVPDGATLVALPWNKPVPDLTGAVMDLVLSGGYDAETKRMVAADAGRVVRVVLSMSVCAAEKGRVPRANEEVDWAKVLDAWEADKAAAKTTGPLL